LYWCDEPEQGDKAEQGEVYREGDGRKRHHCHRLREGTLREDMSWARKDIDQLVEIVDRYGLARTVAGRVIFSFYRKISNLACEIEL